MATLSDHPRTFEDINFRLKLASETTSDVSDHKQDFPK